MAEPICVRRAATLEEASIVVAWLEENGIQAAVEDPSNPGVMAFGVTDDQGIAVVVADAETARRALELFDERDRGESQRAAAGEDA